MLSEVAGALVFLLPTDRPLEEVSPCLGAGGGSRHVAVSLVSFLTAYFSVRRPGALSVQKLFHSFPKGIRKNSVSWYNVTIWA